MDKALFLEIVKDFITGLENALSPYHDASEHAYQDDPEHPGMCKTCGWFNMNDGNLHREVASDLLEKLNLLRYTLENGNEEQIAMLLDKFYILIKVYSEKGSSPLFPFDNFPTISLN